MDGASEIGFTILSMTLSLAAVFIPLLFMGGIVGRLLSIRGHHWSRHPGFGFVSLVDFMLCSRFLRHQERSVTDAFSTSASASSTWLHGY